MISTLDKVALETSGSLALKTGFDLGWAPGTATYLVGKGIEGWTGSSPIRRNKAELLGAHGTHAERGFKDERLITVTGHHVAANRAAAGLFADDLAAYLGDGTEGVLRVDDASLGSRWVEVYLAAGGVDVTWTGGVDVKFQINMVAPDPRKYGTLSTSVATGIPVPGNGLVFPLFSRRPTTTSTRTNLATNPSFETASGTVNVRTNLIRNPNLEFDFNWYSTANEATAARVASTQMSGDYVGRITYTGTTVEDSGLVLGSAAAWAYNTTYTISMDLLSSQTRLVKFSAQGDGTVNQNSTGISLTANVKTRVSWTFQTAASGVVALYLLRNDFVGGTLDFDSVLAEASSTAGTYFDGATPAGGDFTYVWSGTANASTSIQQAPGVASAVGSAYCVQSSGMPLSTGKSMRLISPLSDTSGDMYASIGGDTGAMRLGMVAGKTYTISATRYVPSGVVTGREVRAYYRNPASGAGYVTAVSASTALDAFGKSRVSVTMAIPPDATEALVRLYNGQPGGMYGDVWWDDLLIEEASTLGTYFDGSSPAATIDTDTTASHAWSGTANASTSIQTIQDYAGPNGVLDIGSGGYLGRASVTNPGTADAGPRFTIWGDYVPGFTLTDLATGRRLVYTETITTGQTLVLDANDGSVTLDGYAPRDSKLVVSDWTRLGRGETGTWQLDSPGSTGAQFTVGVTPAWW